jgi:hypothetical protein
MSDGIDAGVHPVEATAGHPVPRASIAQPEPLELRGRYDAVLLSGQLCDRHFER